ncbi:MULTISPECIES: hypothetical protein [unclassified Kribbella]|uniref:hypothetical protein n=1 Tax=unclassified Kribbella TaxID=2644121 RepID=UPI00301916BF
MGALIFTDIHERQATSRYLLSNGISTTADSVELNVYPGKGSPFVGEIFIKFRDRSSQPVQGQLLYFQDDDPHGLSEHATVPAPPGTRYAAPLTIAYDPATVLATVDAQLWLADRRTPRIGVSMAGGGLAITLVALGLLTRDARRRGVAWWQWYTDVPDRRG